MPGDETIWFSVFPLAKRADGPGIMRFGSKADVLQLSRGNRKTERPGQLVLQSGIPELYFREHFQVGDLARNS